MPKVLEYDGTNKPCYPMDVILSKQAKYEKEKENEKSSRKA